MVHHQFGANFEFRSSLLVPVRLWISFSFFLFLSKTINFLSFWYLIITFTVYISSLLFNLYIEIPWHLEFFSHWPNINQFDWLKIIPSKSHFVFLELFFHKNYWFLRPVIPNDRSRNFIRFSPQRWTSVGNSIWGVRH